MGKIRVADYITSFLAKKGVTHCFSVTGGGAMYLNDAFSKQKGITPIYCHHEQSCAMAAVGYTKHTNRVAVVVPTAGCGSTNVITGLLDAWQDSNKLIVISGQVNKKDTTYLKNIPLRKLGLQEVNIISVVKPLTKYAVMIEDPEMVAYHLEKAYHLCESGRHGPVWVDVPLDIQSAYVEEEELKHFVPENIPPITSSITTFEKYLSQSSRPIVIAGNGITLAGAKKELKAFIERYDLPTAVTFLGLDFLEEDHDLYVGRIGLKGTRAGNFAVANADLIIALGSSLSIPATGFLYKKFGREAKIIAVDIDKNEHLKETVLVEEIIEDDVLNFLTLPSVLDYRTPPSWTRLCRSWKEKWSIYDREDINELNMYSFSKVLSQLIKPINSTVVTDAGSANYVLAQSLQNSKLVLPAAQGEMGFMIPAAIGVAVSDKMTNVIGVTGEGSFQFNLQELQTIVHNKLPIKLFILNNGGYLCIRNTQKKYFNDNFAGCDEDSGVSFPDPSKIASAYGLPFKRFTDMSELLLGLPAIIECKGPILCEVMCPHDEEVYPTAAAQQTDEGKLIPQPLENMSPFLSREEFEAEMIITPL